MKRKNATNILGWLIGVTSLAACSGSSGDTVASSEAAAKKRTYVVSCDNVVGGKGEIQLFEPANASEYESAQWGHTVIALGMQGTYDPKGDSAQRLTASQGDRPDVVEIEVDGSKYVLRTLDKRCPGKCESYMVLSSGGGDNEENTFIHVDTLTIDAKDGTLKIEGTEKLGDAKPKPATFKFKKCNVDEDELARLNDRLKAHQK